MKKFKISFVAILTVFIFTSCKENINNPDFPTTEDEIYNLSYSNYKYPSNFYHEDSLGGSLYYENTISTTPLNNRSHSSVQLCTNNIDTAKHWSELSSNYSSYYRDLVSQCETEKYFEFKRVYSIRPSDVILSRVHKSSYLDRSMYDFFNPGNVIGVFKKNNFNQNDAKELIEYLWFTENYNNASSKVHRGIIETNNSYYNYYLYEIEITFGDFGMKDSISYVKHTFKININSGEITHEKELINKIAGKQH